MDERIADVRAQVSPATVVVPAASWALLAALSGLTFLSALFVALTPAGGQTELVGRTWEQFAAADAEVAALFSMQLSLVGLMAAGFSLVALIVIMTPYRRGQRWAWYALWLFPVTYGLGTARMLSAEYQVGFFYAGVTILWIIGLAIPLRHMFGRTAPVRRR